MSKRERKAPEKLTYDEPDEEPEKVSGSGTPLGEIEAVKSNLSQSKKFMDAVHALHFLVFKVGIV